MVQGSEFLFQYSSTPYPKVFTSAYSLCGTGTVLLDGFLGIFSCMRVVHKSILELRDHSIWCSSSRP